MSIFENPPQESTKKESTSIFEKAFSFLKSLFRKDLRNLKENIENAPEATEVADVAFEDFKNSLLAKKTTNGEGKEKPFYSAQLLGTVNFFGETLLKPILEHEYEGNLLDKFLDEIKQHTMDSLLNSRVSEEEKTAFWADFEEYRIHVRERIHTKDDLAALKNGNVKLTQEYETTVNTQLEEQVQTKVSTDRQQYIDEQKKLNTSWTEASLVATGRIGTIPKSNPKSEPFERSAS
ncbi:MAG: hypothetical protein LBU27_02455 [Candidatus Peribacteria bacterium]|jgi:hypothetical protein|nr:hypothetical protein [Candidatus Peribacteria bacterium]